MTLIHLWLAGWIAGLIAYVAALALLYRQGISGGDLRSVAVTSLLVSALCFWLIYVPALRAVRKWMQPRASWVYPVVAMLLGLIPTALVARFWGGSLRAMVTPEALLFYVLFAVVGLVVGVGFTFVDRS